MFTTRFLFASILLVMVACGENQNTGDDFHDPECSDGIDNDEDGTVDFPEDLGCVSAADETEDSLEMPQCNDGRDNDGDGKTDYPNDPGCLPEQADNEGGDDCPDGNFCPQCSNGKDDDNNGSIDFPNDPGCESAGDNNEFLLNPVACGAGLTIRQLPANGMAMGMLEAGSVSTIMSPCGGGGGAPAVAFALLLTEPKVITASTDNPGTSVDTVLDIRAQMCTEPQSEIACHDDIGGTNKKSKVTKSLAAGIYYIIVQGHDATASGAYELKVDKFNGQGTACTTQEQCGPGLVCRTPFGASAQICTNPVCSDGLDDDGDGDTDHPNDPGCASPADDTEEDDCPSGPNCPDCSDGVDNEGDTNIDFPMDTSCKAAGDTSESCTTSEPIDVITGPMTMGTTVGAVNDFDPTCNSSVGLAPDRLFRIDIPAVSSLTLNLTGLTTGFDTVSTLLDSSCGGTAIKCSDPTSMNVTNLAAGTYFFVVEGYATDDVGAFTIATSGTVAPGGSCEGVLYQSGALTCATGFVCDGPTGARTCRTQCSDGIDNNSDGKTDYPADPGCATPADNMETTVCPGASCPACADGIDNDADTKIDYPMDTSCIAAGSTSESCVQSEPIAAITAATTMGTTAGQTNDFTPACGSSSHSAPDLAYQLDLPTMQSLTVNLTGFDGAHSLLDASCGGTAIACSDPSLMTVNGIAAGRYFVVVDGWGSGSGAFTLTVGGQVAPGGSCEGALFTSGALTCATGTTCGGTAGAKTCRSQCSDGIDNNGNGKTDYPNDPACTSPADDSEDNVCPGAMCPTCSNTVDDDADTMTDFPADFGCASAAGMNEVFCPVEPNFGNVIAAPMTMGNLATAQDNYDQTCQSNTGNDMAYALKLPVPVASLQIDTLGSTITDTVLSLKDANCSVQLGCDDDGAGNLSRLTVGAVPAGNYAIQVDGYSTTNNGAFRLNVKGTVAPGTACTNVLFTQGVLVCPTGTSCTSGTCQ